MPSLEDETTARDALPANGLSRRRFMQLMGSSLALAEAAGCRFEQSTLMPESRRPEGHIPGATTTFATACELAGVALPLLVTSYEGRPIKVEGNPGHPASGGATDLWAQASILELYDPDRSRHVIDRRGGSATSRSWDDAEGALTAQMAILRQRHGAGLAILAESTSSPTFSLLRLRLTNALPALAWYEYEPWSHDNEREGARLAFGTPYRLHWRLREARVVACFDADPLRDHPAAVEHARAFASRRLPQGEWMSRWYVAESLLSSSGAVADHRRALPSSEVQTLLFALDAEIHRRLGVTPAPLGKRGDLDPALTPFLAALAADLVQARGEGAIIVGPRQPPAAHAVALRLNLLLGNLGRTLALSADAEPARPHHAKAIASLAAALDAGQVDTLVIIGGNPVYNAPADLELARALARARQSWHLSLYRDETSRLCTWHLPRAHYLEGWSDARTYDGTVTLAQPLIQPLYGGRTSLELLAWLAGDELRDGDRLVRRTVATQFAIDSEPAWQRALRDGFVAGTAREALKPELRPFALEAREEPALLPGAPPPLEVVFAPDSRLFDGRFANNAWLQEQPDLASKITWDSVAVMAPATAAELGATTGSTAILRLHGRALKLPLLVQPGQAERSVALFLGGGRSAAGHVGGLAGTRDDSPIVGADAYALRTARSFGFARGLEVEIASGSHALAVTQSCSESDSLGRRATAERLGELCRRGTLEAWRRSPGFAKGAVREPPLGSLWREPAYDGHRWAMAIDLSRCTGCGACLTACQAENNVPVVGKEQVLRHREMHWLRLDRYFEEHHGETRVALLPVACQHCELAPCESVCPVNATVHSHEGLNNQVYNRCVGTRYCANNCPYKVRRFNYFNFHKDLERPENEVKKLAFNPEVTVRSRGVMEKCSFCVQRLMQAKIRAKNDQRLLRDGEIVPACAQACPAAAIVFGDLADSSSEVARWHADPRAYALLGELNNKPRTAYLARITNPNLELARI
jgi:Fe-S-cluster-containing dehydrogenase component